MSDLHYYAIGDVHGEVGKLDRLLGYIREDARYLGVAYRIVFLGDLIDRGPDSRSVVERVRATVEAGEAVAVKGNHEEMMLNAFAKWDGGAEHLWDVNGGTETVASYKRSNGDHDDWRDAIDKQHIAWLRALPVTLQVEARGYVFVHAGIDPKVFPACTDEVRMWTRSHKFFDPGRWPDRPELEGLLVVHGHTPTNDFRPHLNPRRINVDTGACFGGPLTSVVLAPNEKPRFLNAATR